MEGEGGGRGGSARWASEAGECAGASEACGEAGRNGSHICQ